MIQMEMEDSITKEDMEKRYWVGNWQCQQHLNRNVQFLHFSSLGTLFSHVYFILSCPW